MEKMFYALSAICVMLASNFMITTARKCRGRALRYSLSFIAYIGLLAAFVCMLAVLVHY